jgi:SPP1 gp7 family putative phage head morphogenesis protein
MPQKEIDPKDLATAFDLPPEEAIKFLRKKGYRITFTAKDLEAIAHQRTFTVAGVTEADVLMDVREMLDEVLVEGTTYEKFAKEMETRLGDRGWSGARTVTNPTTGEKKVVNITDPHRMETIFRTNVQSALNAGRYSRQVKAGRTRPYVQILVVNDDRTSDICEPLTGLVFRMDDPALGRVYGPNHHRCRTTARTLSDRDLDRKGLTVMKVDDVEEWEPGDGFDALPDAEWKPKLAKYPKELAAQVKKKIRG